MFCLVYIVLINAFLGKGEKVKSISFSPPMGNECMDMSMLQEMREFTLSYEKKQNISFFEFN